ncbi:solute carrier family 15 member 1 [Synchiropus splendidus]|uniref:solute carrier family 15 member 1 n=1 Tax=Synchiropus splendidus TaxID=270530 RepID=UPI00237EBD0B|nr:solute carrier family 15 member 1 [Synchiropus splendidus]
MRAVLVLYFKYFLLFDDDLATSVYHAFVALCYLTPILGAIVADSWLGKFKTIIYLSIVYAVGQVAMAVSAIHDITDADRNGKPDSLTFHIALSMVGLILIALGTGGIKPCVAAFGGDQFNEHQEKQRKTFFSVFYLCINGGSLLSTIITPILRAQQCGIHTKQSCYALAFGVPAALMVVALVVFIVGSGMYYKAEPEGNIMLDVCKCIAFSIKNRFRHRDRRYPARSHWLDWAEEKYDKLLIAQIKMVLKVLFLYIPLPMFWTLFDQKGSRWTLQATTMNGDFGLLVVQPDQMQVINPILILTLVPIMDSLVYPLIQKCFNFTPLRRMTVGMFMAAVAFFCAGVVQIEIDKTLPTFPSASQSQLKLLNMRSTPVTVSMPFHEPVTLEGSQATPEYLTFETKKTDITIEPHGGILSLTLEYGQRHTLLIPANVSQDWRLTRDLIAKPQQGNNTIRFVNGMASPVKVSSRVADFGIVSPSNYSKYLQIKNGLVKFTLQNDLQSCDYSKEFGFGSSYTFFIPSNFTFGPDCQHSVTVIEDIKPNSAHLALQIPQYFFITLGEVMFSVTGLEFSYSQAPSNMKAVLQAGWLFTVAVGNIIVLIVAEIAKLPKQWAEYFLFASLLVAVCFIFSIMAYFYTYIDPNEIEAKFRKQVDDESEKNKHKEMELMHRDSGKCDKRQSKQTKL